MGFATVPVLGLLETYGLLALPDASETPIGSRGGHQPLVDAGPIYLGQVLAVRKVSGFAWESNLRLYVKVRVPVRVGGLVSLPGKELVGWIALIRFCPGEGYGLLREKYPMLPAEDDWPLDGHECNWGLSFEDLGVPDDF